jgi:hypothetical protein
MSPFLQKPSPPMPSPSQHLVARVHVSPMTSLSLVSSRPVLPLCMTQAGDPAALLAPVWTAGRHFRKLSFEAPLPPNSTALAVYYCNGLYAVHSLLTTQAPSRPLSRFIVNSIPQTCIKCLLCAEHWSGSQGGVENWGAVIAP